MTTKKEIKKELISISKQMGDKKCYWPPNSDWHEYDFYDIYTWLNELIDKI